LKNKLNILSFLFALICFQSGKAGDGHPSPFANFIMSGFCWGSTTSFTNTSTNLQNQGFQWTILQQGVSAPVYTSTNTNISFQFTAKTNYTVTLNVKNYVTPTHFHQDEIVRMLTLDSFPIANFDLAYCQSQLVNLSCCVNTSLWDFGDGSPTSTVTCPTHTYTIPGNYTVTLITGNGTITDTLVKVITANADVLTAGFTINLNKDTVVFTTVDLLTLDDSLRAAFWDWLWDFGDGNFNFSVGTPGWQVKHYYEPNENDSTYKVKLVLKDVCFAAQEEKDVFIKGKGRIVTGTHVFPSPVVHGYLNVESDEMDNLKEIKIVDCLGKRLDDLTPSPSRFGYYIYVGHIPVGTYIIQLIFNDRVENHKFIKE
jgi:hypothetical protein